MAATFGRCWRPAGEQNSSTDMEAGRGVQYVCACETVLCVYCLLF